MLFLITVVGVVAYQDIAVQGKGPGHAMISLGRDLLVASEGPVRNRAGWPLLVVP